MARTVFTSLDMKDALLLDSDPGAAGQLQESGGTDAPPRWIDRDVLYSQSLALTLAPPIF